ncbi:MAG: cysteine desulfurase family protein [Bacteroidota bacterium]
MPYLDHAATTPLREEVLDAMLPWLREEHGNASSLHGPGRRARAAVDRARRDVADVLNCEPGEILFTSGGTEADNTALRGVLTGGVLRDTGRPGLVTSAAEHEAILRTAEGLREEGHPVTIVPPLASGAPDPDALAEATDETTGLVSAMLVNNEVGAIADIARIGEDAHERGALCHTDAVQAAGLLPLNVDTLGVDLLSLSGHKVNGPKGIGALYVRSGTPFAPFVRGGAQERGRRGGTENVAAIVGLAAALGLAEAERETTVERLHRLRDRLVARLGETVGTLRVNTPEDAAPHILNVSLPPSDRGPLDGEMLLLGLDVEGTHASAGSACTSGALTPSHVLLAMGVPRQTAEATVRFSLGRSTTEADVDEAADAFARVVQRVRAVA